MSRRALIGLIVLIIISMLPLIPWYFFSPVRGLAFNYENVTHSLGQMAALVGMTMFSLTFVLSTRIKAIDRLISGLDKAYSLHHILGSLAFILLLFHPILLVLKFVPTRIDLAARYLLPFHGISVDLGIIALGGMIALLAATYYMSIKYNYWLVSHKWLGLFFLVAIAHIFLVRGTASRDYIFTGYYAYVAVVSIIGASAFLYSLLLKRVRLVKYRVKSVKVYSSTVFDISLEPIRRPLRFQAGQFAFFRFHRLGSEYHPYSIASATNSKTIRVMVKSLGDYTEKMGNVKKGDLVSVEGPYGGFTVKNHSDEMLWIGAGIGITPFLGMAKDIAQARSGKARLFYCARTEDDLVAADELFALEKQSGKQFSIIPWCSSTKGRISLENFKPLDKVRSIYLCGSLAFKDSLISQFVKYGIPRANIHDEDFAFK